MTIENNRLAIGMEKDGRQSSEFLFLTSTLKGGRSGNGWRKPF